MSDNFWIAAILITIVVGSYFLGYLHGRQERGWKVFTDKVDEIYSSVGVRYLDTEETHDENGS